MKSFRSRRALSPIFATLILIAIAVIAGIVVYMFTSGTIGRLTGDTGAGSEKVAIQTVQGWDNETIALYAMSQSGGPVTLDSAVVKDAQGSTLGIYTFSTTTPVSIQTTLTRVEVTSPVALTAGTSYSVQLVSKAGGNFPTQTFKVVAAP